MSGPDAVATAPPEAAGGYKDPLKKLAHRSLDPLVRALLALGLKADHLTAAGFALSLAAASQFATGRFQLAALLAAASGLCDILDGQLARRSGAETRFGAFLDSTLDRVAEAALFAGIAFYYTAQLADMAVNFSASKYSAVSSSISAIL